MHHRQVSILAVFVAAICQSTAYADDSVIVAAKVAEAAVMPRSALQKLVNLPALDFGLRAVIHCKGQAHSLTLSVADTFTTLGHEQLEGQRAMEVLLTVPARQLAVAASSNFCVTDDAASADELTISGLATAHASLQCAGEHGTSVHFASAPLLVRLRCAREASDNQVSSPDK